MEEKKNNAVEKAENAVNTGKSKKKNQAKKPSAKKETAHAKNSKKEQVRADKRAKRQELKEQRKIQKQKLKAEKEKALAEKRVELARIKAHKKAEREKAKATALREKNRRKAELKEKKQTARQERLARKQMLKNESKKERERRIHLEKIARRDEREKRRKDRAEKRKQILADKRQKREQKSKDRQKRREQRKGYGGWLAAVISLGLSTLVLASVLTFTFLMPSVSDNMLESTYQQSFYDTVEMVDNIDLNLSKILASKDSGAIQKYLVDTAIDSELAENGLQQLPLHDESKFYTTKLINQIGDFSKYLNKKIIDGQGISSTDRQSLNSLYQANLELKNALQGIMAQMSADYSFSNMINAGGGDLVISNFNELQNLSVQYPELIYDGPFSDGQSEREIKGLEKKEVSFEQAKENFVSVFKDYPFSEIVSSGKTFGDIECYNIQGRSNEQTVYAQISVMGGKLIMFDVAGECNQVVISEDSAIENALEFLQNAQINDMKPVWINLSNNVYTINFAFEQDGIIIYSDLVKVRVCGQTGNVLGLEAKSYYTNHTDRVIAKATLTKAEAKQKLSDQMEVDSARLVVVPIGTKSEKLCYEFSGTIDQSTYYVYIDAISGRQVEMFKVIESTEGTLLM